MKKLYFVLIELIMLLTLVCACSAEQKTEETPESTGDAQINLTASEQSDVETDDVIETDDESDVALAPDLNHNGIAEEVRLTDIDDGQGLRLEIWENDELIDYEVGYFAHSGWTSIFLCTLDGEDYLLRYRPTMYQGACVYSYELSTLTGNKETMVRWNEIDFDINFGSPIHYDYDPEAIAAFMDEVNDLLSHSVQILNTDSDLLATFEKEGRLYDSLWWLDNWEPEFIRDENKSLQENLEDFRTAIMAAQEPMTLAEADGLPITEHFQ